MRIGLRVLRKRAAAVHPPPHSLVRLATDHLMLRQKITSFPNMFVLDKIALVWDDDDHFPMNVTSAIAPAFHCVEA